MKANYKKIHRNEMWIPQEVNLNGLDVSYSAYTLLVAIYTIALIKSVRAEQNFIYQMPVQKTRRE